MITIQKYVLLHEIINELQHNVNDYHRKLSDVLKKKAYCEIKLFDYDNAIDTLRKLRTTVQLNSGHDQLGGNDDQQDLKDIKHLIADIKTHVTKVPSLSEYLSKTMTAKGYRNLWNNDLLCKCGYDVEEEDEIKLKVITPKAPVLRPNLYGHKVLFP
jgi:uncharacterized protein YeeX (DUF496 family)